MRVSPAIVSAAAAAAAAAAYCLIVCNGHAAVPLSLFRFPLSASVGCWPQKLIYNFRLRFVPCIVESPGKGVIGQIG